MLCPNSSRAPLIGALGHFLLAHHHLSAPVSRWAIEGWLVSVARRGCDAQQHASSARRDGRRYRLRVGALVSLIRSVLLYSYVASAAASPLNETGSTELLAEFELSGSLARLGAGSAPRQPVDTG